ncbi:MAG: ribosome maturation factor RimP [Candidatus Eisenbacteria bacterium]|nr:ribosome maturation factor RimP [Candidatus Eisenbacteria bacterium]
MQETEEKLFDLARGLVEGMDLVLVDVSEVFDRGRRVLCFYIDHPGGVSIDDCGNVSRELAYLLDARPEFEEGYVLQVSSPGLEHRLRKEREYRHFAGRRARLVLKEPEDGESVVTGVITAASDGLIHITGPNGDEKVIPLAGISRARLVVDDPAPSRGGRRPRSDFNREFRERKR